MLKPSWPLGSRFVCWCLNVVQWLVQSHCVPGQSGYHRTSRRCRFSVRLSRLAWGHNKETPCIMNRQLIKLSRDWEPDGREILPYVSYFCSHKTERLDTSHRSSCGLHWYYSVAHPSSMFVPISAIVLVKNYWADLKQHARGMKFLWKQRKMSKGKMQTVIAYKTKGKRHFLE